ncbi:MAG: hypothetical protein HY402_01930 [Elusimicrobia bacterium]|nr:hypothetical protein [Elusimicrobiota bacterium]
MAGYVGTRTLLPTLSCLVISAAAYSEDLSGKISGKLSSHWLEKGYQLVVYVDRADGPFLLPKERPIMNQINLVYVPHVLPLVKGWEVEFQSKDKELHNLLARFKEVLRRTSQQLFNTAMPPGSKPIVKKFDKEGIVTLLCSIHPEMSAYILVLQNPYFTLVKTPEGKFEIGGVPAGKYDLKVWGEKLKPEQLAKTFPVHIRPGNAVEIQIAP